MYDYLKGTIEMLTPTNVVIECAGVGYAVNISLETYREIENLQTVKLFVHQYIIQQEAPVFYGFSSESERSLFRLLISVSGIGANTARIMLSSYKADELVNIIATGNIAAIKSVKGIGIKTAERTVLELKSKVLNVNIETNNQTNFSSSSFALSEAIEALQILGYNKSTVEKIARAIYNENPSLASNDIIRQSLSRL